MLWRLLRHHRPAPTGWSCRHALQFFGRSRQRYFSSNTNSLPTIKSVLALRAIQDYAHTPIQVSGSVRTIRKQKRHAFLEIGDGSTLHSLQVVLNPDQAQGCDPIHAPYDWNAWLMT